MITNPKLPPGSKEAPKSFNYDYSYWSHDVSAITRIITGLYATCSTYTWSWSYVVGILVFFLYDITYSFVHTWYVPTMC